MIEKTKTYWLYIASHVYCNLKDKCALLYNTQTGENIETDNQDILTLLRSMHDKKNLGAINCEGKLLVQEPYFTFVTEFRNKSMGNLVDILQMPEKPVQLMPVLNLQRDVDKLQKEKARYTGEDIMRYLLELNLYLHTVCNQYCLFCSDYFRQSLCCRKENAQSEILDIPTLQNIISQIRYCTVGKINLLGGNILEYPYYQELPSLFADLTDRVHVWNHYANLSNVPMLIPCFQYDIPVTFPIDENAWLYCISFLKNIRVQYHFYITNKKEYEKTIALITKYNINKYAIHPVYTKINHHFFEECVYTDREDIFQTNISFRKIFAHQKLNTYFFGSLTISPAGDVYAGINNFVLGNIKNNTFLDIISKEMLDNTAWRKIRDNKPCLDCLYQYLCSSPSNYEMVIGKPNLCNVKK